jgi:NAD(P)H-hydrate epimerase
MNHLAMRYNERMATTSFDATNLSKLHVPQPDSHKGDNGRVLVIGGSKLFHASIFWAAQAASKFVDLVHFSSPANENNDLVRYRLKQGFWEGIVVDWSEIDHYIQEDDVILIGPGMPRNDGLYQSETPTSEVVNKLVSKYPDKKWVIDGGALQEIEPSLLNDNHIITPHSRELARLAEKICLEFPNHNFQISNNAHTNNDQIELLVKFVSQTSLALNKATILAKGPVDVVCQGERCVVVKGGNAGMTKGGTGDVLAGVVAALYAKNNALLSARAASYLTKKAGEKAFKEKGYWFGAGDLLCNLEFLPIENQA